MAASVAAPAGSITHTTRGAASAFTRSAEAGCRRRALGRQRAPRLRIAVVDHAGVPMPHEPPGDVGAHAPEPHHADLHVVSLLCSLSPCFLQKGGERGPLLRHSTLRPKTL